ncbi:hypothetical protein AT6N2_C2109 [Agrobacterium tumefaciens]|nr:hypothetical protein AT6N2_C2109 [Agrobacterium tumefaciens]
MKHLRASSGDFRPSTAARQALLALTKLNPPVFGQPSVRSLNASKGPAIMLLPLASRLTSTGSVHLSFFIVHLPEQRDPEIHATAE